ncbi:MAG TPA: HD-GYP domain-containing protein [Bacilli bacterium]
MLKKRVKETFIHVVAIVLPYIMFIALSEMSRFDLMLPMPKRHFFIVSTVALLAMAIAGAVAVSGLRLRNIRLVLLSLAFISLAEVFVFHGLSTPGMMMINEHVPAFLAQLSVSLTSIWLFISSLSADHLVVRLLSRWLRPLIPAWVILLTALCVFVMVYPESVMWLPLDQNPVKWTAAGISMFLNMIVIFDYWQSYRFTRFPLQGAIVYSTGWLLIAQLIIVQGKTWHLSWWLYHFLLLGALVAVIIGLFRQYVQGETFGTALRTLFQYNPAERIKYGISASVRSLIVSVENHDAYTAGHNYRVAVYALRLAREAGFSPDELRALAQGAIVHDIGKIEVPSSILNKPGKLTADERKIIERHPVIGYEMCRKLGFMKEELEIIRSHHEKWDGTGYPDNLRGGQIPTMARLLAVVDVYDALTSERAYRKAWTHEKAMEFIEEQSGKHFDPRFVAAWKRVCASGLPECSYPAWTRARASVG